MYHLAVKLMKPDKRELEPTGTGRRFGSRERMNFEVPENMMATRKKKAFIHRPAAASF